MLSVIVPSIRAPVGGIVAVVVMRMTPVPRGFAPDLAGKVYLPTQTAGRLMR